MLRLIPRLITQVILQKKQTVWSAFLLYRDDHDNDRITMPVMPCFTLQ